VTYYLVYASLLLCGLLSSGRPSNRVALYYLCLVGLFFFVGFRYKVGCDWDGYLNIFRATTRQTLANSLESEEPAFGAVNVFLHYYELEYPYVNVIASAGFFLGLNALARRQPDRLGFLILAFPILILNLAMSGIRQAIAVGLMCFAYNAFVDRRTVRYVLLVVFAAQFHHSALIFLGLAPFAWGAVSRAKIVLAGLLALPGAYFLLTSGSFDVYAQRYIGGAVVAAGAPFRSAFLALPGVIFLLFLARKWREQSIKDYQLVSLSSYMMLAIFPLSFFSSVIGDRFGYYLYPIQLVILARLPVLVTGPYSSTAAFAPYAAEALLLLTWVEFSALYPRCYEPYTVWW
jgi:hypothetical protein